MNKFRFMYRVNKFLIRDYKLKMNFYRVSASEFEDNYMIRLVKKHFLFPKTTYVVTPRTDYKINPYLPKVTPQTKRLSKTQPKTILQKKPTQTLKSSKNNQRRRISFRKRNDTLVKRTCNIKLANRTLVRRLRLLNQPVSSYLSHTNFLRCATFYSNLTLETLYHGVLSYNRRRYKRRKGKTQLIKTLKKKLLFDNKKNTTNSLIVKFDRINSNPTPTRLLSDLQVLKNAKNTPHFLINYLFYKNQIHSKLTSKVNRYGFFLRPLEQELRVLYFAPNVSMFNFSNITPYIKTRQIITRKLLKLFKFHKFTPGVTM